LCELLFKFAYVNKTGQKIINPKEFIRLVKEFKKRWVGKIYRITIDLRLRYLTTHKISISF